MATIRDALLPTVSSGWAKVQQFGVTQYTITRRIITWSGGDNGPEVRIGTSTNSDLVLVPNPWVTETESGSGLLLEGITPAFAGGGYTPEQLNPSLSAGQELVYLATGANGSHFYVLTDVDSADAFEIKLRLAGKTQAVPY